MEKPVKTVSIGMDGTCMLLCDDGYREAMVGTIAFYDKNGDRQHTTYMAATPGYGKDIFLRRFEQEIINVKKRYSKVHYVGVTDEAKYHWSFLKRYTDTQTLDFWHVTEYLAKAANVMFRGKRKETAKSEWLD